MVLRVTTRHDFGEATSAVPGDENRHSGALPDRPTLKVDDFGYLNTAKQSASVLAHRSHDCAAMGTLLLVGEESRTEGSGETERSAMRCRPSLKDAVRAVAFLSQVPPDVIVSAGPLPDVFVLFADAAERAGRVASRTGVEFVVPATVASLGIALSAPATALAGRCAAA